jgi:hypothetical protein
MFSYVDGVSLAVLSVRKVLICFRPNLVSQVRRGCRLFDQ